jgi:hypothetical protein
MDIQDTHEEGKATKRSHTLGARTWRDIAEWTLPASKALVRLQLVAGEDGFDRPILHTGISCMEFFNERLTSDPTAWDTADEDDIEYLARVIVPQAAETVREFYVQRSDLPSWAKDLKKWKRRVV